MSRSAHEPIVFCVRTDPVPHQVFLGLDRQGSVRSTNAYRPEATNSLEVEGRMVGICLQQLVVLARELLNGGRKFLQARPELGRSEMLHMPLVSPRPCAANASAANRS